MGGLCPRSLAGCRPSSGLSPLSLHPLCPSGHTDMLGAMWCLCRKRAPARSLPDFAIPWLSCPVLLASPQPHRATSPCPSLHLNSRPWAAHSLRPPYFMSLLFVRGGPGSVTCAALYGAVCKNKPIGILVSRFLPDPPSRPDPVLGLPRRGRKTGGWRTGGQYLPKRPQASNMPVLFSFSLEKVLTWTGRRKLQSVKWTALGAAGPSPSSRSALGPRPRTWVSFPARS